MPCAAIDRAAIRFTGDEADVCIFSFKLVLELVIKEKSQLCPSVTVNQKENRIPLQLCFVSCGVLAPPSPEEFILSLTVLRSVLNSGTVLQPVLSSWP